MNTINGRTPITELRKVQLTEHIMSSNSDKLKNHTIERRRIRRNLRKQRQQKGGTILKKDLVKLLVLEVRQLVQQVHYLDFDKNKKEFFSNNKMKRYYTQHEAD